MQLGPANLELLTNRLVAKLYRLTPLEDKAENIQKEVSTFLAANGILANVRCVFGHNLANICAFKKLFNILTSLHSCSITQKLPLDLDFVHPLEKMTPLHLACGNGSLSIARYIVTISKKSVSVEDMYGFTPLDIVACSLFKASLKGDFFQLMGSPHFVSKTSAVNVFGGSVKKNCFGQTPLHFLHLTQIREKMSAISTEELKKVINERDLAGRTPLMAMAMHNSIEGVQFLLDRSALVNERDKWDRSALFYAAFFASLPLVRLLRYNSANPDELDHTGKAPLDVAKTYERDEIVSCLEPVDLSPVLTSIQALSLTSFSLKTSQSVPTLADLNPSAAAGPKEKRSIVKKSA